MSKEVVFVFVLTVCPLCCVSNDDLRSQQERLRRPKVRPMMLPSSPFLEPYLLPSVAVSSWPRISRGITGSREGATMPPRPMFVCLGLDRLHHVREAIPNRLVHSQVQSTIPVFECSTLRRTATTTCWPPHPRRLDRLSTVRLSIAVKAWSTRSLGTVQQTPSKVPPGRAPGPGVT